MREPHWSGVPKGEQCDAEHGGDDGYGAINCELRCGHEGLHEDFMVRWEFVTAHDDLARLLGGK